MPKKKEVLHFLNESLEHQIQKEIIAFENTTTCLLEKETSFFLENCPSSFSKPVVEHSLENLTKSLQQLFENVKKEWREQFFHLNSSLCEVIPIILENPFVAISKLDTLKIEYLEKMSQFFEKKEFQKKVSNEMAIFTYQISIAFHLHQNVSNYQLLKKLVSDLETHFFLECDQLFASFKNHITDYFNTTFGSWFEDLEEDFYCVQKKNVQQIQTFALDQLKEKTNMILSNKVKVSFQNLKNETLSFKKKMYEFTHKKDCKRVFFHFQDYLLSYHNMLYYKVCSLIDSMNEIVFLKDKEKENEIKNYQEFIYKIMDMKFQLDQPFLDYTSYYMGFFSKKSSCEKIDTLRKKYQETITLLLKNFTWDLLRSYLDVVNEILYREKMVLLKTENLYELLDEVTLKNIWKKVN